MAVPQRRHIQLKPSQLNISISFPQRENPPPLQPLKDGILEYGGLLRPLVVRPCGDDSYLVLDGRRIMQAVWALQNEGHEKLLRWLPCYCIHSDGPVMDLRLFLLLNSQAPLGVGEYERAMAAIEDAAAEPVRSRR
jgi:hypothetical protein